MGESGRFACFADKILNSLCDEINVVVSPRDELPVFGGGSQMDWLSKQEKEATEAAGRYTWHQQPSAKVRTAIMLLLQPNLHGILNCDGLFQTVYDTGLLSHL